MSDVPQPKARHWLIAAFAALALNMALTFHNLWPTLWILPRPEVSIEFAALLLALVGYVAFVGPLGRTALRVLTALLLLLGLGRYLDVTAPALYGRPVNLYWDAQHLPKVAAMLAEVAPWWLVLALLLGIVALIAAFGAALHWCLTRIAGALLVPVQRRAFGALAGAAVALYAFGTMFESPLRWFYSVPVSSAYLQQAEFLLEAYAGDAGGELPIEPLPASDLGHVAGADVLLMFLESYGAATYDLPAIEPIVAPARAELAAAAVDTGRRVVSAFFVSPTFGGGSWLAHSTLMSGFEVREPGSYARLLTQQRDTLPKLFKAHGYRAVALMPGLKSEWPEGAFYGFDTIYGEREIDYRGPDFGWWRIPDQYALAALNVLEPPAARGPLFIFLPTINTHIPFLPTPPYQPDWARLHTAEPFDAVAVAASNARTPDWESLGGPYAESFVYTFTYLAGYLREEAESDAVLVFIGDHQPAASVAGLGARWDVPVHIVTRRHDIAATLLAAGFIEGVDLRPQQPALGGMPEFTTLLLHAFDSGPTSGYSP